MFRKHGLKEGDSAIYQLGNQSYKGKIVNEPHTSRFWRRRRFSLFGFRFSLPKYKHCHLAFRGERQFFAWVDASEDHITVV
jgi:hypothetical protein